MEKETINKEQLKNGYILPHSEDAEKALLGCMISGG